jgi:hypothetical protein
VPDGFDASAASGVLTLNDVTTRDFRLREGDCEDRSRGPLYDRDLSRPVRRFANEDVAPVFVVF